MRLPAHRWGVLAGIALLVLLAGGIVHNMHQERTIQAAANRLETLLALRKSALEVYLSNMRSEAILWSGQERVTNVLEQLSAAWQQMGAGAATELSMLYLENNPHPAKSKELLDDALDGSAYSLAHARLHPRVRSFREYHGYYDVFLIDANGNVIYTTYKEDDFATNLRTGPWRDTGLAKVYAAAAGSAAGTFAFADFAPYPPSGDVPAAFIGSPVYGQSGELTGVLAFQVPVDQINTIMLFNAGMGRTGETYLVGSDLRMRTDSRFSETSTILDTTAGTDTVELALAGESGVRQTVDYRGEEVLSAYAPLQFGGVSWAVVAEMDMDEILEPVRHVQYVAIVGLLVFASIVVFSLLLGRPRGGKVDE